ncbi:MAG: enolase C-terminal domain-like protein [Acidimicrobiales bacterium]
MSTLESVEARVYEVATDQPEADGTLQWSKTIVVAVLARAGAAVGTGWTYASGAAKTVIDDQLADAVVGRSAFDVPRVHEQMVRACRNLGRPGVVSSAISAVDTALWDLKARVLGIPLVDLFGRCRDDVPVYGSGGFTTYDDDDAVAQLSHWVSELGIPRVKIKIGESWGSRADRDLHRVELARQVVGAGTELYVDANGGYTAKQAVRLGRRFQDFGVSWFEEPVSSDDLAGLRLVREALDLDVAAGEYGYDEPYFDKMVRAEAVDCVQVDVTRCGGFTAWLRVAALAGAHGLEVSAHCAPNLHVPVAASVPNLRHVEYFHDHSRLDPMLFEGIGQPKHGALVPGDAPGHGMTLRPEAEQFRVA